MKRHFSKFTVIIFRHISTRRLKGYSYIFRGDSSVRNVLCPPEKGSIRKKQTLSYGVKSFAEEA